MDSYIGKKLNDRYEIQDLIGYGSMSSVYKAQDQRLGRTVAVRILNQEISRNEALLARFYEESQKISVLAHANIVEIYDINQHQDIHYIVMEYLDGLTLKQFIEYKNVLSWNETVYFSLFILKALEYAHAHDVVHRDLKPQNVFILRDGSVKVTDFSLNHILSDQVTISRTQMDSVYYLSPEQANGEPAEARSDLYSLGVIMYEMLTGRVPYTGASQVAVAVQHVNGIPVPPRSLQSGIPIGLQQITLHAMNSSIQNRYYTAMGMRKDLETLQQNPRVGFRFKNIPVPVKPAAEPAVPTDTIPVPEIRDIPEETEDAFAQGDTKELPVISDVVIPEQPAAAVPEEAAAEAPAAELPDDAFPAPEEEPVHSEPVTLDDFTFDFNDVQDDTPSANQIISGVTPEAEPDDEEDAFDEYDDAAYDDDYDDEEYDEDEDDDEDDDRSRSSNLLGLIILLVILAVIAVLVFIFKDLVKQYIDLYWSVIQSFIG